MIVQCSSSLTLEGSVAQIKMAGCPALGTEGVTDAAEPRQSDQLAAPMDKRPRRLGKKHTNSGICREGGGNGWPQSEQTPNTAGSAANTCTHAHTHCLIHSNAASCAVTSAYPAQDKFTQSLEHPVHPVLVCSVMIFMTWTPAIRETQHHKPNTHAGTQSVNAIPSSPAHSTYKQKKKYRQCKNLLWRSVKSSLDFSPLPVSPQLQSI